MLLGARFARAMHQGFELGQLVLPAQRCDVPGKPRPLVMLALKLIVLAIEDQQNLTGRLRPETVGVETNGDPRSQEAGPVTSFGLSGFGGFSFSGSASGIERLNNLVMRPIAPLCSGGKLSMSQPACLIVISS